MLADGEHRMTWQTVTGARGQAESGPPRQSGRDSQRTRLAMRTWGVGGAALPAGRTVSAKPGGGRPRACHQLSREPVGPETWPPWEQPSSQGGDPGLHSAHSKQTFPETSLGARPSQSIWGQNREANHRTGLSPCHRGAAGSVGKDT